MRKMGKMARCNKVNGGFERLIEFSSLRCASQAKSQVALFPYEGSLEAGVALGTARADVGLDVGLLDAGTGTEVTLGLTHGGSSEEESVGA